MYAWYYGLSSHRLIITSQDYVYTLIWMIIIQHVTFYPVFLHRALNTLSLSLIVCSTKSSIFCPYETLMTKNYLIHYWFDIPYGTKFCPIATNKYSGRQNIYGLAPLQVCSQKFLLGGSFEGNVDLFYCKACTAK